MPTNLLGAVAPGVEYAKETEEEQKRPSVHTEKQLVRQQVQAIVTFWYMCIFTFLLNVR